MSSRVRKNIKRWSVRTAIVLIVVGGGLGFWLYRDLNAPVAHARANDYIEIPRGSTPDGIADKLVAEGVLKHKWPWLLYIKTTGKAKSIRAGEYRFPSPISALGILRKLQEGEQRLSRFTVIEGWTRWDIADSMARMEELHLRDSNEALALMDDAST